MQVHRLCRLCLTHSSYHSNIFSDNILNEKLYHLINSICEINASRNDGLPEYICVDCFQIISRTVSFIRQAKDAVSALKLMVNRNKQLGSVSAKVPDHNHPDDDEEQDKQQLRNTYRFGTLSQSSDEPPVNNSQELLDVDHSPNDICNEYVSPKKTTQVTLEGDSILKRILLKENPANEGEANDIYFKISPRSVNFGCTNVPDGPVCGENMKGRYDKRKKSKGRKNRWSGCKKVHYTSRGFSEKFQLHAGRGYNELLNLKKKSGDKEYENENTSNPYTCSLCGKLFISQTLLNVHFRFHIKKHICQTCGRGFHCKANFMRHLRKHSDEREFSCVYCEKSYKYKDGLRRHMVIHSALP